MVVSMKKNFNVEFYDMGKACIVFDCELRTILNENNAKFEEITDIIFNNSPASSQLYNTFDLPTYFLEEENINGRKKHLFPDNLVKYVALLCFSKLKNIGKKFYISTSLTFVPQRDVYEFTLIVIIPVD
jgi:hypothetical protein